ncbi:enoyl-CoA hydratase/isomerase family protein [Nocardioides sp. MAH-18]|uniref:Enoyl-CoA hydratase/isomerase family protein n=1 Tax=Nocardioides agri TaxID=2682843 RepID=A0A6L6Y2S0_9ACTN|nr:enoyl-CoA hydratase/isomerase family protein [Nocardioides sp. CGMCC 1.13656]MBA2952723.1 enoyl-CoA hydratase/isomerase family protein [Nocardioides sp. CGMCC 1.13656]MVQ51885.1 enoyl-CoA hydratase/isomerase family protein [Nocardioides sp. MAH-18]
MEVEYVRDGDVAVIHLNRPERLNAVVPALTLGLRDALARADREGARVVVLAGRGRAFCAGHDLKEPEPVETPVQTRARLEEIQDVTRLVRRFPGPVVAAVHGYALGAGCEFALACDVVVAAEDAQFGFPEVGVGLSVTGGISKLLPALVGWAKAKELLLLGDRVTGAEAAELGLVARAVPAGEHEEAALDLARTLAQRPPLALSLAKQVLDHGLDATMEGAMAREVDHAILTSLSGEGAAPKEAFGRG